MFDRLFDGFLVILCCILIPLDFFMILSGLGDVWIWLGLAFCVIYLVSHYTIDKKPGG